MTQDRFLNTLLPLQPAMQLVAERLLHSEADAEDAVQEVVVELWHRRDELEHVRSVEAYAMQCLKHRCVSLLRQRRVVPLDEAAQTADLRDEEARAEAETLQERSRLLDRMMRRLPKRQREAVQMRYLDQLSHEQMQQRLGMSSTAVYTLLSRAMTTLKQMANR